jgi:ribosomal RNA assembly protein
MTRLARLPQDRLGALIGPNGDVKATIERRAKVRLRINSETGDVEIVETTKTDPLRVLQAEEVVKAIGRGFTPESAYDLFREDMYFAVIDLKDYAGHKESRQRQIRGRVIGEKGRTRRMIEEHTGCKVSIQGTTVAMIGEVMGLEAAKRAVDMLLSGSEHSTVYGFLEREHRMMRLGMLDAVETVGPRGFDPRDRVEEE